MSLRDAKVETTADDIELGMGIRVVHDGVIGFAATVELHPDAAAELAEQATALASGGLSRGDRARRARRRARRSARSSGCRSTRSTRRPSRCATRSLSSRHGATELLESPGVDHVTAYVLAVTEDKHYADLAGTFATQRRVRLHPNVEALAVDDETGEFETMRTICAPVGRGWEYMEGRGGWDPDAELAEIPELLAAKVAAPSVEPGHYDLVIDPSNLFLTIHESIGHATELDRALGYEAAYAGTSFATFDKLGTLQVRLRDHERHRGPQRRPTVLRPSATTTKGSRRRPSTSSATASSSDTSSTGGWRQPTASVDRTDARSPTRRSTSRSSAWRTSRFMPADSDGPTTA